MSRFLPTNMDYDEMPLEDLEASEGKDDADLWFLPVSRLVPDFN